MRLVFPGGEHAQVELAHGTTTLGSAADCGLVLSGNGVVAHHCSITTDGSSGLVVPLDTTAPTVLNGRQIVTDTPINDGDLLLLGRVGISVIASVPEPVRFPQRAPVAPAPGAEADGRTRVRAKLPRYMLRGVSGATLGKTFALSENGVIGRQADCDIAIPAEEISRQHARLRAAPDGVQVEDLGSANGTFINDKRVQTGLLKPGDELRLDTVRFRLVTPGMDARQQSVRPPTDGSAAAPAPAAASRLPWILVGLVVAAVVVFAGLRYAGMI